MYELKLTGEQVNTILQVLNEQPFKIVFTTILNIESQVKLINEKNTSKIEKPIKNDSN